jgi:integrase
MQIGSAYWLHVPVGKLHTDRHIPLHPQLKGLLDAWLAQRPDGLRSDLLFVERGRPIPISRVDGAVLKVAHAAGIGHVSPHQPRHTGRGSLASTSRVNMYPRQPTSSPAAVGIPLNEPGVRILEQLNRRLGVPPAYAASSTI